MAKAEVVPGTWFSSGYHGHFRSKSRLDFINEYRHLAKPHPPKDFINRSQVKSTDHTFSKHDNRHSFCNDALYFEGGLGRRRFRNNNRWHGDLLAWMPQKKELVNAPPQHSVYRINFQGGTSSRPIKEQMVRRPKTSFDDDMPTISTYRYAHGTANPNRELLCATMRNAGLKTQTTNRRVTTQGAGHETVAQCLNWYNPPKHSSNGSATVRQSKPLVPAATEAVLAPHPPTKPRTATAQSVNITMATVASTATAVPPSDVTVAMTD